MEQTSQSQPSTIDLIQMAEACNAIWDSDITPKDLEYVHIFPNYKSDCVGYTGPVAVWVGGAGPEMAVSFCKDAVGCWKVASHTDW